MTVGINGVAATNYQAEVDLSKGLRVNIGPNFIGSAGGRYRASLSTNLATVISAITATGDVGQLGQFRWGSLTKTCLVDRLELEFVDITKAGTLQSIILGVRKVSAHTATASGGTSTANVATIAVLTGDSFKLRNSYPTTALTDFRMTDTADLTCGAGARALDVQDILTLSTRASATAGESIPSRAEWNGGERGQPIVLTANTGLSVMNRILWGATLTAKVTLAIEWREILNEELYSGL
jgi:hypothetical protein